MTRQFRRLEDREAAFGGSPVEAGARPAADRRVEGVHAGVRRQERAELSVDQVKDTFAAAIAIAVLALPAVVVVTAAAAAVMPFCTISPPIPQTYSATIPPAKAPTIAVQRTSTSRMC